MTVGFNSEGHPKSHSSMSLPRTSIGSVFSAAPRGRRQTAKQHQVGLPDDTSIEEERYSETSKDSGRKHLPRFTIFGGSFNSERDAERTDDIIMTEMSEGRSFTQRVAYFLDRVLAKRWSFFLALAVLGLCMVLINGIFAGAAWGCAGLTEISQDPDFTCNVGSIYAEGLWLAWTFMADPGTQSGSKTSRQKVVGSLISMGGILFMASILGVTVDMVREKMDSLRQGKSRIVETDHTLILGWTEKTLHIIEELVNANESEGGGVVAILAPYPKEVMESELAIQLPVRCRKRTRVIFRNGSPLVLGDLVRVSVETARAILVLATTGDADRADADTLRTMLLLRTMSKVIRGHVVAEVRDIDNEPLVSMVGGRMADTLVSHDMVGRLMLLSARQPGLAKVYEALLGFEGDEFYREEWPELLGTQFKDLQRHFPDAIPIGVYTAEKVAWLLPYAEYRLKEGDQVMVLAEDNDTYAPTETYIEACGDPPKMEIEPGSAEKILFCGWRRDIRDLFQQLDKIVQVGSEVHMMTHCVPLSEREERLLEDGLDVRELKNLVIIHHFGNTSVRRKLESLPMETYTSCMIFADQVFEADTMHADSHSLATLLLIRDIQAARSGDVTSSRPVFSQPVLPAVSTSEAPACSSSMGKRDSSDFLQVVTRKSVRDQQGKVAQDCPIVCEILDPHTQRTIAESKHLSLASDFCQTNRLIAQVLTMVAEDRTVKVVLDELLGSHGVSIAVVHASRYCEPGEMISFYSIVDRGFRFGEIVIGYQARRSIEKTVLNPANKHLKCDWTNFDFAILERGASSSAPTEEVKKPPGKQKPLEHFSGWETRQSVREVVRDARADRSSMGGMQHDALDGATWTSGWVAQDQGSGSHPGPPMKQGTSLSLGSSGGGGGICRNVESSEEQVQRLASLTRDFLRQATEAGAVAAGYPGTAPPAGSSFVAASRLLSEGERTHLGRLLVDVQQAQGITVAQRCCNCTPDTARRQRQSPASVPQATGDDALDRAVDGMHDI